MGLKEIFKKQGGFNLIKQYQKGGALFTAVCEFLLLGKSRTALEILRLSTTFKIKRKLERKYKWKLDEFEKSYIENEHKSSNKIWICWFQGIENAPELVRTCYESVINNYHDKEVVLITRENMNKYVNMPQHIMKKWSNGIISDTHMTDLLRLDLLINHGGMWLDATVLCTGRAPEYFFESDLFFYQNLKPGRDGDCQYISSWLIGAKTNNKILMATRELCFEYWKRNTEMLDYFLLHDFMAIVLDNNEDAWKRVVPRDNATPHLLLMRLFDKYDDGMWNAIKGQTQFHKLSYKFDEKETKKDTYYEKIIRCHI